MWRFAWILPFLYLWVGVAQTTPPPQIYVNGQLAADNSTVTAIAPVSISFGPLTQCGFANVPYYYTLDGTKPTFSSPRVFNNSINGAHTPVPLPHSTTIRVLYEGCDHGQYYGGPVTVNVMPPPVILNVNIVGNGSVSPSPGSYSNGSQLNLAATPSDGWTFISWSGDITGTNNPYPIFLSANTQLTATFGSPVIVAPSIHGSILASTNISGPMLPGAQIEFTPVPEDGYYFASWGGVASGVTVPFSYVHTTANSTISATFLPLPVGYVSLAALPATNGHVVIFSYRAELPTTNRYATGETMFARAIPAPGFAFSGWNGDLAGTINPAIITLDRSKIVGANFTSGFTVTLHQTDGGNVNLSSRKAVYPPGTILDLQAVNLPGFEFAGWSGDVVSAQPTIEVVINSNFDLFARFRAPLKQPLWSYVSPSSALFSSAVDSQGQVYAADRRGIVALDADGNLRWRTITADGTNTTNSALAIDKSGNILTVSVGIGQPITTLQRLTHGGDPVGPATNVTAAFDGLALGASGGAYLGGTRLSTLSSNGTLNWEFRGLTPNEQNDGFPRVLSRPALDSLGNIYFAGTYSLGAGGATRMYGRRRDSGAAIFATTMRMPLLSVDLGGPGVIDFTGVTNNVDSSPVVGTDRLYFVDSDGSLVAARTNGSVLWRYGTLDVFSIPSIGDDGTIYVGARNSNRFYAINPDGSVRWIKMPGIMNYTAPAIGRDGTIYVADVVGLYALNSNGDRLWEFDSPMSAPVIAGNHVYATGGALYAFQATGNGTTLSPWPMRNASARNDATASDLPQQPQFDSTTLQYLGAGFQIRVLAPSGLTVTLYASTNLVTWTTVDAKTVVNGEVEFIDATAAAARCYKAVMQ